ncbi:alcohol dehydrogenase [Companilactobacillus sp. RD055328]|uniref:zinc-binding dehydrogenase n=1 Tax=Companilactobacillus sp. RD055328 TaxID=2916634 RepID=UPI001FC8806F|nr:zinc-binding dehydrogenase [Companilactobacillus sp. RD055328]GKQ42967.1 alcohol dehydrogenase [Companilactobacillus sp. RD055328]
MYAYTLNSNNQEGLNNLQLNEMPVPNPQKDEVLIQVNSIGLNPVDYKLIEKPLSSFEYPHIFGLDAAGTVVSVGENVKGFKVGDRVAGHNNLQKDGTFAEYAIFPDYSLAKILENVTFETAAALLCGAMTAYQAIFRKMNLTGKKNILIHAGAGGVGSIALQLAKLKGLDVITTVSSSKKPFVTAFSPDKIIDYKHENVSEEINKYTNDVGVDLILNTVGGNETYLDVTERLAYNGELVSIVNVPNFSDNNILSEKGLTISALNLGGAHSSTSINQKKDLGKMALELLELASTEKIDANITEVLPFNQLISGLKKLYSRDSLGKIIVKI